MKFTKQLSLITLLLCIYSASSQDPYNQRNHQQRHHGKRVPENERVKKVYAMCPPTFVKIGNECYHLSAAKSSWLDAHFECKDKNAKLAEPVKSADRTLRKFLIDHGKTRGFIWLGGMYNWARHKWQWGYNGKEMTYQSFSRMSPGEDLKYSCTVLNPDLKYRWTAKKCFEKHFYLCQHHMPFVSERSRQKVYTKWNETYPGQLANEVQVFVTSNGTNRREYYRATSATPKRHDQTVRTANYNRNNGAHLSNEINPAEVLANRDAAVQNKLRRNKKQQTNREHKSLRLSGNVDLGNNVFKQRKSMKRKKVQKTLTTTTNTPTATTEHPNFISQVFHPSNHHRHNHNAAERQLTHKGTTQSPKAMTSTPSIAITSTLRYPTTTLITNIEPQSTTSIQIVAKQLEKKRRLDKVRQMLSSLTEEEKLEYLRLKAERKANKKVTNNDTIP